MQESTVRWIRICAYILFILPKCERNVHSSRNSWNSCFMFQSFEQDSCHTIERFGSFFLFYSSDVFSFGSINSKDEENNIETNFKSISKIVWQFREEQMMHIRNVSVYINFDGSAGMEWNRTKKGSYMRHTLLQTQKRVCFCVFCEFIKQQKCYDTNFHGMPLPIK